MEDIISRSVSELRKNAFGEDIEDTKSLSWTREQAWTVLKQLTQKAEVNRSRCAWRVLTDNLDV